MLKKFQNYSLHSVILIVSIGMFLFIKLIFFENNFFGENINYNSVLYNIIKQTVTNSKFLEKLLIFVVFAVQTLLLIRVTEKLKIFDKNTYIAGLIYVLLAGLPFSLYFNPIIFANIFLILGIVLLLKTITEKKSQAKFFNVGLFFSISSLIYTPYVFLFILGIISVILIRSRITREIFAFIIGFLTIQAIFFEMFYIVEHHFFNYNILFKEVLQINIKIIDNIEIIIFFFFFLLFFAAASFYLVNTVSFKEIEKRTTFTLLFVIFVFSVLLYVFIPSIGFSFLNTFAISLTFLFGNFFSNIQPKKINSAFFVFYILIFIVFQIFSIFLVK